MRSSSVADPRCDSRMRLALVLSWAALLLALLAAALAMSWAYFRRCGTITS